MLVDLGLQLNLIPEYSLDPETLVIPKINYHITAIGKGSTKTYGDVTFIVKGVETKFQFVDDKFPMKEQGILGVPFSKKLKASLIFDDKKPSKIVIDGQEISFCEHPTFNLPPRTKMKIQISVSNSEVEKGYNSRIDAGPSVFIGEALARQEDAFAEIFAINSTNKVVSLTTPPVEVLPFYASNPSERDYDFHDTSIEKDQNVAERLNKLDKLFTMDDLTDEEKLTIMNVVCEYSYEFYLLGDKLKSTSVLKHNIHTTDEEPVFTR